MKKNTKEDDKNFSEYDYSNPQEERVRYGEEKPKAKDTARLIWASKPKKEPNSKDLDFQTAEEVYPNIAEEDNKRLINFVADKKEIPEQPNRLIWGDNILVMQALLSQGYEGQIDLVYIDPPFNTGENFNFPNEIKVGDNTLEKEMPISERLAYSDTWARGLDSFLDMLYPRLQLMKRLLSNKGSIFVHCDANASHYIKLLLDEIFGKDNFRNEIIVRRIRKNVREKEKVPRLNVGTDSIFFYSKSSKHLITPPLKEDKRPDRWHSFEAAGVRTGMDYSLFGHKPRPGNHWRWSKKRADDAIKQRILRPNPQTGKPEYFIPASTHVLRDSLWDDITAYSFKYGYPTEKNEELLKLIIEATTSQNDLVADFFCGSGTTIAVAEQVGRRWITSDLSKTSIQVTRGRLVNQDSKSFLIQNLGNYQRQLIYAKEVNLKQMYDIVLKLYGATPRNDWQGFGISKEDNKTLVFVCEPDRPMTGKKAFELAKQTKTADGKGYKKLVILAWDYEYTFDDSFNRLEKNAKGKLSDVEFKIIPSDVYKFLRSTKVGDQELANKIIFYQKPYIRLSEPQIISRKDGEISVKIRIEQYVVMDIPVKDESKRPEIEKLLHKNFANLIDYWTVDWDYDGNVFKSKWQAIRDRKSSEPVPTIADATLKKGKKYIIAVRVVDVFGNDASMTKEIDLR